MSLRTSIWTIVVILVLAVLGWWFFANPGSTPSGPTSTTTTTTATTTAQAQSSGTQATTLRSLATQGGNYTCTIETTTSGSDTTGTIYSAGGKTRLDLTVAQNNGTTVTHIIRAGTTSYTWVDGQSVGIKAAITPTSAIIPQPQGGVIAVNDGSMVSSMCHPWIPDASQFVPPAGITFKAQ